MKSQHRGTHTNMGTKCQVSPCHKLHICFFPLMAQGHTIPAIAMAKLFASRGLKTTVILTPLNVQRHSENVRAARDNLGLDIEIVVIEFSSESPEWPSTPDMINRLYEATTKLGEPLEKVLREQSPDCLVADLVFPWATNVAAKLGIPRVIFQGIGFFSLCATQSELTFLAHEAVNSDLEPFVLPNFPGEFELMRNQLSPYARRNDETKFAELYKRGKESEVGCFGVLVNSFYELESDYADHYRRVLGRAAWHVGPLSMMINKVEKSEILADKHECLEWLDSKSTGSVVYVCFGSMPKFSDAQLLEIAAGLESSKHQFVWVVKRDERRSGVREEWLPEGFEERMTETGLIVRGWAPQMAILKHEAVGAFVTHCGWNSSLEAVSAGLPMVTWPLFAEQFFNEILVTRVLRIGVEVGAKKWERFVGDFVKREAVERAVIRVMVGEEAEEMRTRARLLAETARKAIEKGGSSETSLDSFIEELRLHRCA